MNKPLKKRINLSIDPPLHEWAVNHAKSELFTDFSGYVSHLLSADRTRVKAAQSHLARLEATPEIALAKGKKGKGTTGSGRGFSSGTS